MRPVWFGSQAAILRETLAVVPQLLSALRRVPFSLVPMGWGVLDKRVISGYNMYERSFLALYIGPLGLGRARQERHL